MSSSKNEVSKIATVVYVNSNETEVAINRGSVHGVKMGHRYLVYANGDEITDPDTGESLGILEIVRGTGKVINVQDKMSTLKSDKISRQSRTVPRFLSMPFIGDETIHDHSPIPFENIIEGDLAKLI